MIIRDAHTNPYALRLCRRDGHAWTGDRCDVCRSRRLEGAAAHSKPRGGDLVAVLEVRPTRASTAKDKPEPPTVCEQGHPTRLVHVARVSGGYVQVVCDTCREAAQKARLNLPCQAGHVGRRYESGRSVGCHDCDALRGKEYRRATSDGIDGRRKLSDEDVATIRAMRSAGQTQTVVAARFGIHVNTVRKCQAA